MAHLILTRNQIYSRKHRIHAPSLNIKIGKITLSLAVILLLVLVSFSYLTISNQQITYGYEINSLKSEKSNLIEKEQQIAMQVDQAKAITNIESAALAKGMRKNENFIFMADDTEVAKK